MTSSNRHSRECGNPESFITDNLDIWSSAIKNKASTGRGSSKKIELYGIKKLRELILELAVRGLLVDQDKSDQPASVLLEEMAAERARLVKQKKIKKPKNSPELTNDDIPFIVPESWAWARLPDVCSYGPGKTPATKNSLYWDDGKTGIPWVSIADMDHYQPVETTAKFISREAAEKVFKSEPIKAGTLLMSFKLTVGKISKLNINAYHNEAIISIYPFSGIQQDFIYRFLPSRALAGNSKKAIKGNTLNSESLAQILLPVPPLNEQSRIVAKVDELMALCDQLEQQQENSISAHQTLVETLLAALTNAGEKGELTAKEGGNKGIAGANSFEQAWARIAEHFDTLFTTEQSIDQLKQTILQLAVMGKLVPQDPNDEPASALLEKIAAEKAQLIKEKKIKKQKPLPPISEDEKPFKLPEGWALERVGNLTSQLGSGSTPRGGNSAYTEEGVPFLRSQNVWNDGLKLDDIAYIPQKTHDKMGNTKVLPGDVLLNITGASLGRSAIFPSEIAEANVSQHVTIIRLLEPAMARYVHLGIMSPMIQQLVWGRQVGMAIEGLSKKVLERFEFPVPPLEEQHRIVAKVDQLMTLCDQLKTRLNQAQATQLHLADAVAEQALTH